FARPFGFHVEFKNFSVTTPAKATAIQSPDRFYMSLLFASVGSAGCKPGIVFGLNQARVCGDAVLQLTSRFQLPKEDLGGMPPLESLSLVVSRMLTSTIPKLILLAPFCPSVAFILPHLTIEIPLATSNGCKSGLVTLQKIATIVIPKAKMSSVHFSLHVNMEHATLDLIPLQKQICHISSLSFWNDIRVLQIPPSFPTYLPCRIELESFLTMNDPTLLVNQKVLLDLLSQPQSRPQERKQAGFLDLTDVLFLESLFQIKMRVNFANLKAGCKFKLHEPGQSDFLPFVAGEQLCLTISSISKDSNSLNQAISHGMLNVMVEHTNLSVMTSRTDNSTHVCNFPPKHSCLVSLPASRISITVSSEMVVEGSFSVQSASLDLSSIAQDMATYELLIPSVASFLAALPQKDTSQPQPERGLAAFAECKITILTQLETLIVKCSSSMEPFHAIQFIGKRMAAKFCYEGDLSTQLELGELLLQTCPHNYPIQSVIAIGSIHLKQKRIGDVITGASKDIHWHFNLSSLYILIKCSAFIITLNNTYQSTAPAAKAGAKPSGAHAVQLDFKIPQVHMHVELPECKKGTGLFSAIGIRYGHDQKWDIDVKSFVSFIFKEAEKQMAELAVINNVVAVVTPSAAQNPMVYNVHMDYARMIVPNDWPLANIIENGVNLIKAVKNVLYECLQKEIPNYFAAGATFFDPSDTPSFVVKSELTEIILVDNHFEAKLGRNYQVGYDENLARLTREKEFMKKAKQRFPSMTQPEYEILKTNLYSGGFSSSATKVERDVYKAWMLLQDFNSKSYVKLVSNYGDENLPPLMKTVLNGWEVIATIPQCLESIEITLHKMDENTPPDMVYDDLVCRQVKMTLTGIDMRMRDYTNPLLQLPKSPGTSLTMEGLIVIADPYSPPECKRMVYLPLDFDDELVLTVARTVNPTKVYMDTVTQIITDQNFKMALGAPFDPCMADIMTVVDNFTKTAEDLSPPVGWWDKVRILVHGTNTLRLTGGGKVSMLALGSHSPYFDPRKHYGVEGMEWSMSNGLEIIFGHGSDDPTALAMTVECGELKVTVPRSIKHTTEETNQEICFSKLTGGVRMVMIANFVTPSADDPTVMVRPFRKHHELAMQSTTSVSARRQSFVAIETALDSYYGFRSPYIYVTMQIDSPRNYYSSLAIPQNCLFLSSETMIGVEKMIAVYQSLLTNVPVRRGNLFNMATVLNKPKLGRAVTSVHLKTVFRPLMFSFTLDCENGVDIVGIRLKAEQTMIDAVLRQYDVKLVSQSLLDRKPVTKWIREQFAVSFLEIEGRVLSYCRPGTGLFVPSHQSSSDMMGWVFKEDNFKDLARVSLLPCIWAPKVDFIVLENAKQTQETEDAATKAINEVQLQIFKRRLAEIDQEILNCKEKLTIRETRSAVFFDDTDHAGDLYQELDQLAEKKLVILSSIRECQHAARHGNSVDRDFSRSKVFDSKYIIHNLRLLWNESVRNIIFRMVEVESKNRFLEYCLSNSAAQVAAQLVDTMSKQQNQKDRLRRQSTFPSSVATGNVQDILDLLLDDVSKGVNLVVPCEVGMEKIQELRQDVGTPANTYFDPADGPPKDVSIENDVLVRFINPQVNFEVLGDDGLSKGSVFVTAMRMQVKFLLLMDTNGQPAVDKDRQDTIIKFRNIWSLEEAQFLVFDQLDQILNKDTHWIPLECLLDQNIQVPMFGRIIDHARVVFQTENSNPVYTNRGKATHADDANTFHFNIPVLRATATSKQYLVIYDLFKNLLVYRDPVSGERSERLKKMLLALEQCEDIQFYRFTVLTLQEKVRQTEFLLRYGRRGGKILTPVEMNQVRKSWIDFRSDLFVLMESLQNLQNIERKRKSLNISWQLMVNIDEFIWLLQQDDGSCLCKWSIHSLNFNWTNNEDQSNVNTLEIDSTSVENLSPSPNMFREVVSFYNPDGREVNFEKQKMIRVYWREAAPVAGIQVVAHFEVNIQPLLIQITYDFGKSLAKYMFPSLMKKPDPGQRTISQDFEGRRSVLSNEKTVSTSSLDSNDTSQLKQMQVRADQNKSFIYIKVPGVQHCLSYRGSKEKNFEDLNNFPFYLNTLEYRNKTWTWLDFLNAIKKDALRAALANTGALVREKLFKKPAIHVTSHEDISLARSNTNSTIESYSGPSREPSLETFDTSSSAAGPSSSSKKRKGFFQRALAGAKKLTELPQSASFTYGKSHDLQPDERPMSSMSNESISDDLGVVTDHKESSHWHGSMGSGDLAHSVDQISLAQKGRIIFGKTFPVK
ncbi:hypothetical protein HDU91_005109, partial [Kappamyces sp. JEL0680]